MGIGQRIKEVAKQKGLSIRQVAETAGVSYNTLYSITKRNSKRIQGDILQKVAAALGVSADVLLCGSELDRDYETVCDSLNAAGLCVEPTGFMDNYYVWHEDTDSKEDDRVEFEFTQLLDIVERVEQDAEANKHRYITLRYETDLFFLWTKKEQPQPE